MKEIHLIVHVTAKAGREEELEAALMALSAPTRATAGCMSFRLYVSERPGRYFVQERWESQAALDLQLSSSHFHAAVARIPALIDGELQIDHLNEFGA